jgi:adenylate cyclase
MAFATGAAANDVSGRDVMDASALLDAAGTGLALVDPRDWVIVYENARFRSWFPPLHAGQPAESCVGPRPTPVLLEVRSEPGLKSPLLLAEAVNITKQKEAEYMLDSYARLMERQARALETERERAERLLLNIMPRNVAVELRDFGTTTPQSFETASVLMLDFVNFTDMAVTRDPSALVAELNDLFTSFDRIMEHSRCERIKTIGDGYMAVAGVTEPDPDHAHNIAHAALRIRRFLERRNASAANRWTCRIGLGYGPAIGSIVGVQKFVYDIFGPAVNLASRLEALCDPMQILIPAGLEEILRDEFVTMPLGLHELKGFDSQPVFALVDQARPGR